MQRPPPQPGNIWLSTLLHRVVESVYGSLSGLVEGSAAAAAATTTSAELQRKQALYNFFEASRQQLTRLLVLARWARASADAAGRAQAIGAALGAQDRALVCAADRLYYISQGLQNARAPVYDVQSAVDVLVAGTYPRLPGAIAQAAPPRPMGDAAAAEVLARVERAIRYRIFTTPFPQQFTAIRVERGLLALRVEREFEAWLTVAGPEPSDPWRLLRLDLLVPGAEASSSPAAAAAVQQQQPPPPPPLWLIKLRDAVQRHLATQIQDPFSFLYRALHEFTLKLRVKSAKAEARRLEAHYKPGTVRFKKCAARTYNIFYWLKPRAAAIAATAFSKGRSGPYESPCLQMYIDEWSQLLLRHLPPLRDPDTGREAMFSLGGEGKLSEELFRAMRLNSLATLEAIRDKLSEKLPFSYRPPSNVTPKIKQFPTREPFLELPLFGDNWARLFVDKGTGDIRLDTSILLSGDLLDRFTRNPAEVVSELATALLSRSAHELIFKLSAATDLVVQRSEAASQTMFFTYPFSHKATMQVQVDEHLTSSASLVIKPEHAALLHIKEPFKLSLSDGGGGGGGNGESLQKFLALVKLFKQEIARRNVASAEKQNLGEDSKMRIVVSRDLQLTVFVAVGPDTFSDSAGWPGHISVASKTDGLLRCDYGRATPSMIAQIMSEHKKISFMVELHKRLENSGVCVVHDFSALSVRFSLSTCPGTRITVYAKNSALCLAFKPEVPPLSRTLEVVLNTKTEDTASLTGDFLRYLQLALPLTSAVWEYIKPTSPLVLPGGFVLLLRRPDIAILVYRHNVALEMQFTAVEFTVRDFCSKQVWSLTGHIFPVVRFPGQAIDFLNETHPVADLPRLLPLMHRLLGTSYVCRQIQFCVEHEAGVHIAVRPEAHFEFIVNNTSRRVFFPANGDLTLADLPETQQTMVKEALSEAWRTKVRDAAPWRPQALVAFARLLLLPTPVLLDFAEALKLEAFVRSSQTPCTFSLCMDSWDFPADMAPTFSSAALVLEPDRARLGMTVWKTSSEIQRRWLSLEYTFPLPGGAAHIALAAPSNPERESIFAQCTAASRQSPQQPLRQFCEQLMSSAAVADLLQK